MKSQYFQGRHNSRIESNCEICQKLKLCLTAQQGLSEV